MTRRDFQLIADVISEAREEYGNYPPIDALIRGFARALPATNPRFDSGRFEHACEPKAAPMR